MPYNISGFTNMASYNTIEYLNKMTSSEMSKSTTLNLTPYKSVSVYEKWDNSAYYSTNRDYAILYDDFKWTGKEGATYDIFSHSFFDPFIIIVYDKYGNPIKTGSEGEYGYDYLFGFVAPYTGDYYVTASWNQGYADSHKYVSLSIYEDVDTIIKYKNSLPTGNVTIQGNAEQGQTLYAKNSISDADGIGNLNFQWQSNGTTIPGATGSYYKLSENDVGKYFSVTISYTDGKGNFETVSSTKTAPVLNVNDKPTGSLTISGKPFENQTLKAINSISDYDGIGNFELQWYSNGKEITGAKSSIYTISKKDVGSKISVSIKYIDGHGTIETVNSDSILIADNLSLNNKSMGSLHYSKPGNEYISGGNGLDVVMYDGDRADYSIKKEDGKLIVSSHDGVDTLVGIERLRFSDKTVAFDVDGSGGVAYRIYKAAFNREPDQEGLGYWVNKIDQGADINSVANSFIDSEEFKILYGSSVSTEDFIKTLYNNVLGRNYDQDGYEYWTGKINSGEMDKSHVLSSFSESHENRINIAGKISDGFSFIESNM